MELKALGAFCVIHDHGSLTRAAAALGVGQSALTQRPASLAARTVAHLIRERAAKLSIRAAAKQR